MKIEAPDPTGLATLSLQAGSESGGIKAEGKIVFGELSSTHTHIYPDSVLAQYLLALHWRDTHFKFIDDYDSYDAEQAHIMGLSLLLQGLILQTDLP